MIRHDYVYTPNNKKWKVQVYHKKLGSQYLTEEGSIALCDSLEQAIKIFNKWESVIVELRMIKEFKLN